MSLGRLAAMCGCGGGQEYGHECPDCQARLGNLHQIIRSSPGIGARWAYPTNYDLAAHRRYRPMGRLGEVQVGETGWMLSDVASLGLIVLAALAVWKEVRR